LSVFLTVGTISGDLNARVSVQPHSHISLILPITLKEGREVIMNTLLAIVLVLVILWLVGFFALPGVGTLIHILLVIAVILLLVWLFTGKKLWK
jgi:hypothetical protein